MRTLTGWPRALAREMFLRVLRTALARPAQFRVSPGPGRVAEDGAAPRHRCVLSHAHVACALHCAFGLCVSPSPQLCVALAERESSSPGVFVGWPKLAVANTAAAWASTCRLVQVVLRLRRTWNHLFSGANFEIDVLHMFWVFVVNCPGRTMGCGGCGRSIHPSLGCGACDLVVSLGRPRSPTLPQRAPQQIGGRLALAQLLALEDHNGGASSAQRCGQDDIRPWTAHAVAKMQGRAHPSHSRCGVRSPLGRTRPRLRRMARSRGQRLAPVLPGRCMMWEEDPRRLKLPVNPE